MSLCLELPVVWPVTRQVCKCTNGLLTLSFQTFFPLHCLRRLWIAPHQNVWRDAPLSVWHSRRICVWRCVLKHEIRQNIKVQLQPHKNTFFVKYKYRIIITTQNYLKNCHFLKNYTVNAYGGVKAKLAVFSKSERDVDDDLSASCSACLINAERTPYTTR